MKNLRMADPGYKKRQYFKGPLVGTSLAVFIFLCLFMAASAKGQGVTIEGTVNLEPAGLVSTGGGAGGYGGYGNTSGSGNQSSPSSIVLWLESEDPNASSQKDDMVKILNQKDQQFVPRLMAIPKGSVIRIKNSDPVYHNVFSLSKAKKFNVGRRSPNDPPKEKQFDEAGIVDVFCDIHSDMHAVIVVLPEQTVKWKKIDREGPFKFSNVPAGSYTLNFYAMGDRSRSIKITAEQGEAIDLGTVQLGS